MPIQYDHDHENEITLFAQVNYRNQSRRFGIKTDDRRRHMYVLGKTGTGKTTLLENLFLSDVLAGHGCCYIDPHGDTAERLLNFIPSSRINDVVYFNPADQEFPVGFNILETTREEQKHLVASGLMGVFKKIWPDVWSARMEYILLNCVLALLDYPGATLLGINRLLVDKEYRTRVIAKIRNPIVKTFWVAEFTSWSEKYATEAIAPVQNKVGQFLSASIIRNIVAQVKSTINPRQVMDDGKILIVNLAKGKIGEDNMRLLGGIMVTKIQLAAMERVDIKNEDDRRDFYLYVDEFQNFSNQSFANILSEARKYHLNLTIAHQYIGQLDEDVAKAVFGNVGSLLVMRVGAEDATFMETEFTPTFVPEDLVNLPKYQMYLKLMVDGMATQPFSATTLPPISKKTDSEARVIAVSRERYAEARSSIEEKILRWSGMEMTGAPPSGTAYPEIMTEEEQKAREELGGVPAKLVPGTPEYAIAGIEALEGAETIADKSEYLTISQERLSAISKPQPPGKKEKPRFSHTCTRCGKVWDMPIQLDPTRPIYCAECLPIIKEERKMKKTVMRTPVGGMSEGKGMTIQSAEPANGRASKKLEPMFDMERGPSSRPSSDEPKKVNRPRIVGERRPLPPEPRPAARPSPSSTPTQSGGPPRISLMQELAQAKGKTIETNKKKLSPMDGVRPNDAKPRTPTLHPAMPSKKPELGDIMLDDEPPIPSAARTATVFRQRTSSVRAHGPTTQVDIPPLPDSTPKSVKPGEKIVF